MEKRRQKSSLVPSPSFHLFTLLFILLPTLHPSHTFGVSARPYTFLISSRPTCTFVDLPQDTQIMIHYSAPDIILEDDKDTEPKRKKTKRHPYEKELSDSHLKEDSLLTPNIPSDEKAQNEVMTDAQKRKEKLQAMVNDLSSQHSDMTITISKKRGRQLKKHALDKEDGTIMYKSTEEGTLQICTQSIMASRNNPRRISTHVYVYYEVDNHIIPDQKGVDRDFLGMEAQLHALSNDMTNILKFADFNKDTQWKFSKVNRAMNAASSRWPLVQIFLLIGAGLLQISYMVNFFKTRHLI